MSDLIDRQKAIELIHTLYPSMPFMRANREWWKKKYKPYIECKEALEQLPSAQPEIIRCKDCKYAEPNGKYGCEVYHYKLYETHDMKADDFCSRAERRTDE